MDQDIIAKKPSSPLATSLLAVSMLCLIGAIIFPILELKDLRHEQNDATSSAAKYAKSVYKEYNKNITSAVKDAAAMEKKKERDADDEDDSSDEEE